MGTALGATANPDLVGRGRSAVRSARSAAALADALGLPSSFQKEGDGGSLEVADLAASEASVAEGQQAVNM